MLREIVERPESRLELTDIDTRSAVVDYVRGHNPLRTEPGTGVTVIRGGSSGR